MTDNRKWPQTVLTHAHFGKISGRAHIGTEGGLKASIRVDEVTSDGMFTVGGPPPLPQRSGLITNIVAGVASAAIAKATGIG